LRRSIHKICQSSASVNCQSSEKTPPSGVFSQSFTNSSLPVTAILFLASTIGQRLCRRPANVRYGWRPKAATRESWLGKIKTQRRYNTVLGYPHRHQLSAKVRSFIDLLSRHSAEYQRPIDPGPWARRTSNLFDALASAQLLNFRVLPVACSGRRSPTGCRHSSG
jgi:hypothetical protein